MPWFWFNENFDVTTPAPKRRSAFASFSLKAAVPDTTQLRSLEGNSQLHESRHSITMLFLAGIGPVADCFVSGDGLQIFVK